MNDAVREEPVDEFVDITWSIIGTRQVPAAVEDYLDTVFDEIGRLTDGNVFFSAVSSNDSGHTFRSLEAAHTDLQARIIAAIKLLVGSGDATPQAERIIAAILAEYA